MLEARTAYECRLYIELHPHDCGERAFPARSKITRLDEGLVAVYDGPCPSCGKPRRFEFLLDPELEPAPPAFGNARPSKIIDPGQFLTVADDAANDAPDSIEGLSTERLERAKSRLAVAAAAIDEVLKFIPAGESKVPVAAFTSAAGKECYLREPGRFERARLEAVLGVYRQGLDAYNRDLGVRAAPDHHARSAELAAQLLEGLDAKEAPGHAAARLAHEQREEGLLEVYYVRSGQRPATARTIAEIELAAELAACAQCKARAAKDIQVHGSGTTWMAEVTCGSCQHRQTLTFTTKGDPRTVAHAPDELGPGPSLQIRVEAFRTELARVLPLVAADTAARQRAVVCLNEIIKLTRAGAELDQLVAQRATLLAGRA